MSRIPSSMIQQYAKWFATAILFASTAFAQNPSTHGNIVSGAATCQSSNCVYYQLPPNTPYVVVTISGTWSGTIAFQSISAPNANYSNLNSVPWTNVATEIANGNWSVATGGATFLLIQAPTWSSGSAQVSMFASQTGSPINNPVFPGTITATGLQAPDAGSPTEFWQTNGGHAPSTGCGISGTCPISSGGTGATTAAGALANLGAAPALGPCTNESSIFTPANGLCYFVTASVSTATPAASAFVLFSVTTSSAGTFALTGTTIGDGGNCSTYISGTTLTLPASQSMTVKSDGTNIVATCTPNGAQAAAQIAGQSINPEALHNQLYAINYCGVSLDADVCVQGALTALGSNPGVVLITPDMVTAGASVFYSGVTVSHGKQYILCPAEGTVPLAVASTFTGTLFTFSGSGTELVENGLMGCFFNGAGNSNTKTFVDAIDTTRFLLQNDWIYNWASAGTSVGFQSNGRDNFDVHTDHLEADSPIVIGVNPNSFLTMDVSNFHDLLLVASASKPCITIQGDGTGREVQHTAWDGNISCNQGKYMFYWSDPSNPYKQFDDDFGGAEFEQATDPTGYGTYINVQAQNLLLRNIDNGGATNGTYLHLAGSVTLENVIGINTTGVCLDTNAAPLVINNAFCQVGSTVNYNSLYEIIGVPAYAGLHPWEVWNYVNQQITTSMPLPGALTSAAVTSATGGAGLTSATCNVAHCTNISGEYAVLGGSFTTGALLTLVWPSTGAAQDCVVTQNYNSGYGGLTNFALGHGTISATGMVITNQVSVAANAVLVDYQCTQY